MCRGFALNKRYTTTVQTCTGTDVYDWIVDNMYMYCQMQDKQSVHTGDCLLQHLFCVQLLWCPLKRYMKSFK